MKRKNFAGWLILSLLPLLAFVLMALQQHRALTVAPLAASRFSADLASTVSYGFVEQPGGDALGGTLGGDAVVTTDHAPTTTRQPTVLERSTGVGAGVASLQKS
jgi:hypothetical protein